MNLRQLEVFHAIMRTGSVTAAARQLHVTQPAVSSVLRHLESRLRVTLFRRVGGRLQPTPEADTIFPHVAEIQNRLDSVDRLMGDLALGRMGILSVAASLTIANGVLARAVASFTRDRPELRVALLAMTAPQVVERVINREVELGVAYDPVTNPDIETESLMRHHLACVMREDHALAAHPQVSMEELGPHRVIMYWSRGVLRSNIERSMARAGIRPSSTIEVNLALTALVLAHQGAGVALIDPYMLSVIPLPGMVARPLTPRMEVNAVLLRAKSAPRSVVMTKFVAHLRNEVKKAAA